MEEARALEELATHLDLVQRELNRKLSQMAIPCLWYPDAEGDYWVAGCQGEQGLLWSFGDAEEGPVENHMSYCPYCGRAVHIIPPPEAVEDEDDA